MFNKYVCILVMCLFASVIFADAFSQPERVNDPLLAYKDKKPTVETELFRVYLNIESTTISLLPTEKAVKQGVQTELLEFVLYNGYLYVAHVVDGQCVAFRRNRKDEIHLSPNVSTFEESNNDQAFSVAVKTLLSFADEIIEKNEEGKRIVGLKGKTLTAKQIETANTFFRSRLERFGLMNKAEHYAALSGDLNITLYRRVKVSQMAEIFSDIAQKHEMSETSKKKRDKAWKRFQRDFNLNHDATIYSRVLEVSRGWHGTDVYHHVIWFSKEDLKKPYTKRQPEGYRYNVHNAGF